MSRWKVMDSFDSYKFDQAVDRVLESLWDSIERCRQDDDAGGARVVRADVSHDFICLTIETTAAPALTKQELENALKALRHRPQTAQRERTGS
ncbi:hypothetical protein [Martelella mangrovi]|uniref:Uncharacterized protein n=1 Tax=Martelella mangrovi TaxID=1397477 RepID=A0ABV2IF62_9HYPH